MMQAVVQFIHLGLAPFTFLLLLPYHITCFWLAVLCNTSLKILVRLGKPPKWYILAIHSRDLFFSLENVQHREEESRIQLEQLKQEVEQHDKDRRVAVRKVRVVPHCHPPRTVTPHTLFPHTQVKTLMAEVTELQSQLAETTPKPRTPSSHGMLQHDHTMAPSGPRPLLLLMVSLGALGVALWQFYNNDPLGVVKKVCLLVVGVFSGGCVALIVLSQPLLSDMCQLFCVAFHQCVHCCVY